MTELDKDIKILQKEVEDMEESQYDGKSIVEVVSIYNKLINLQWMKMDILINKEKNNG